MTLIYMSFAPKSMCRWLLLAYLFLCVSVLSFGQVVVQQTMDTTQMFVGEQLQLKTSVLVNKGQTVRFPYYAAGDEIVRGVEVVACGAVDTAHSADGKRLELTKKYTITSFDSALYAIPPIEIEVDGKSYASSQSVGLKVMWVPVDTLHPDVFADPHTVVHEPFVWHMGMTWMASMIWLTFGVAIVCGIALVRRKPLVRKKVVKPRVGPSTEAQLSLTSLHEKQSIDMATDDESFYVSLTNVVRNYIERRWLISALQQTSAEILAEMRHLIKVNAVAEGVKDNQPDNKLNSEEIGGQLNESHILMLQDLFETADGVKYAKQQVSGFVRERHLQQMEKIVSDTTNDALEHPQPEVKVVVLNDGMQISYRRGLRVVLTLTTVATLLGCVYLIYNMIDVFYGL